MPASPSSGKFTSAAYINGAAARKSAKRWHAVATNSVRPRDRKKSMDNPLLTPWVAPFDAPPLAAVKPEHFAPAYAQALAQHAAEVAAITADPAPPSFANTVAALERGGALLTRVEMVFSNLALSETSDALQAIELEMAPRLAQ